MPCYELLCQQYVYLPFISRFMPFSPNVTVIHAGQRGAPVNTRRAKLFGF